MTVRLEPLGEADVDALLESLIAGAPAAVRARLAQAAAGNPLFAEELVGDARRRGRAAPRAAGSWVLERELDQVELPASLNALLGARLDRLDARGAGRARARRGRGRALPPRRRRRALRRGSRARRCPASSSELAGKDMIRPAAASFAGEVAFRFKHILVREAAYRATAKKLRASLHEHFADWLERLAGERVGEYQEILGYHFEQAYRYRAELGPVDDDARALAARAARHLGAAGRRANDRGDVQRRRQPARPRHRAPARRQPRAARAAASLRLRRQRVGAGPGGTGDRRRALRAGNRARRATASPRTRAARSAAVELFDADVDLDESWAIAEEAIETFTELGDEAGLAQAKRGARHDLPRPGPAGRGGRRGSKRALVHANACGDLVTRRMVTQSLAMILCAGPMPVGEAIRRCEELRDANRDDRVLEAVITRCLSALLAMAGRFDEAREYGSRSSRVLDEANMLTPSWVSRGIAARGEGARRRPRRRRAGRWRRSGSRFRDTLGGAPDRRGDAGRLPARQPLLRRRPLGRRRGVPRLLPRRSRSEQRHDGRVSPRRGGAARGAPRRARRGGDARPACGRDRREHRHAEHASPHLARARRGAAGSRPDDAEADAAVATALELYEQKGNVAAADALRAAQA